MVNTSQQMGGAIGTALLSTIFTSALTRYAGGHPPGPQIQSAAAIHGYSVAFTGACGLSLAGAAITATLLRSGRLATDDVDERDAMEDGVPPKGEHTVDVAALTSRIADLEAENRHLHEVLHIRTVAAPAP
jgi:hypothetical protein